jgi:uncharacterized protein YukE
MPDMATGNSPSGQPYADYDHVSDIRIGPSGMHDTAQRISDLNQSVADSVTRIADTLNPLVLNDWQGATQQEAENFNNRWLSVMDELFGSKDKPDDGALNAMAHGIGTAADNYNKAEYGLMNVWNQFAGKLPTADQGGDGKPSHDTPPDQMDTNKTAITADYPPYA